MSSDDVPFYRLDEVYEHLSALEDSPELPVDVELLNQLTRQLNPSNTEPLIAQFLPKLINILKTHTAPITAAEDPVVVLAIKLLEPCSYIECLQLSPMDDLITALKAPMVNANDLALEILHKAAESWEEVTVVASMAHMVESLINTWLSSSDVHIGEKATRVLADLLETDATAVNPVPPTTLTNGNHANGHDMNSSHVNSHVNSNRRNRIVTTQRRPLEQRILWNAVFKNAVVVTSIMNHCGAVDDERQRSIAQGRLLGILPRLAKLDLACLTTQQVLDPPLPPLLQWAAFNMVDPGDDELMMLMIVDFWETFLMVLWEAPRTQQEEEEIKRLLAIAFGWHPSIRPAVLALPRMCGEHQDKDALEQWLARLVPAEFRLAFPSR